MHNIIGIDSDFERFGISAIDDSTNIDRGRPYGGMAILIRKQHRSIAQFYTYNCVRLLGVQLTCNDVSLLFISVYMPYQCDDNYELFMEYVGKLSALIEESPTSYVAILGDFNAGIDIQFEAELCSNLDHVVLIVISKVAPLEYLWLNFMVRSCNMQLGYASP